MYHLTNWPWVKRQIVPPVNILPPNKIPLILTTTAISPSWGPRSETHLWWKLCLLLTLSCPLSVVLKLKTTSRTTFSPVVCSPYVLRGGPLQKPCFRALLWGGHLSRTHPWLSLDRWIAMDPLLAALAPSLRLRIPVSSRNQTDKVAMAFGGYPFGFGSLKGKPKGKPPRFFEGAHAFCWFWKGNQEETTCLFWGGV